MDCGGWKGYHSPDGVYYYNETTQVTQWEKPKEIEKLEAGKLLSNTYLKNLLKFLVATPPGWVLTWTESGDKYWYNTETNQSTWELPKSEKSQQNKNRVVHRTESTEKEWKDIDAMIQKLSASTKKTAPATTPKSSASPTPATSHSIPPQTSGISRDLPPVPSVPKDVSSSTPGTVNSQDQKQGQTVEEPLRRRAVSLMGKGERRSTPLPVTPPSKPLPIPNKPLPVPPPVPNKPLPPPPPTPSAPSST